MLRREKPVGAVRARQNAEQSEANSHNQMSPLRPASAERLSTDKVGVEMRC
jgi:hypothetical protein